MRCDKWCDELCCHERGVMSSAVMSEVDKWCDEYSAVMSSAVMSEV